MQDDRMFGRQSFSFSQYREGQVSRAGFQIGRAERAVSVRPSRPKADRFLETLDRLLCLASGAVGGAETHVRGSVAWPTCQGSTQILQGVAMAAKLTHHNATSVKDVRVVGMLLEEQVVFLFGSGQVTGAMKGARGIQTFHNGCHLVLVLRSGVSANFDPARQGVVLQSTRGVSNRPGACTTSPPVANLRLASCPTVKGGLGIARRQWLPRSHYIAHQRC
jgi:hypothetical protein